MMSGPVRSIIGIFCVRFEIFDLGFSELTHSLVFDQFRCRRLIDGVPKNNEESREGRVNACRR